MGHELALALKTPKEKWASFNFARFKYGLLNSTRMRHHVPRLVSRQAVSHALLEL
jgi:hypothetical protein